MWNRAAADHEAETTDEPVAHPPSARPVWSISTGWPPKAVPPRSQRPSALTSWSNKHPALCLSRAWRMPRGTCGVLFAQPDYAAVWDETDQLRFRPRGVRYSLEKLPVRNTAYGDQSSAKTVSAEPSRWCIAAPRRRNAHVLSG